MKKNFPFFLLFILCLSCEKTYNPKERYTVDAQINNTNIEPLPEISMELYPGDAPIYYSENVTDLNKGFLPIFGETYDLISFGKTNENGKLTLHFPAPNSGLASVSAFIFDEDEAYKPFKVFIKEEDFEVNYLSLQALRLFAYEDLVKLNITTDLSEDYQLVRYSLVGNIAYNEIEYAEINQVKSFGLTQAFDVQKNQTLQLNYQLQMFSEGVSNTVNEQVMLSIGEEYFEYIIQNP